METVTAQFVKALIHDHRHKLIARTHRETAMNILDLLFAHGFEAAVTLRDQDDLPIEIEVTVGRINQSPADYKAAWEDVENLLETKLPAKGRRRSIPR